MTRDLSLLLQEFEEVIGVQRVLIITKPPTRMTKDHALHTFAHAEVPIVGRVMWINTLNAIITTRALDDFQIGMQKIGRAHV